MILFSSLMYAAMAQRIRFLSGNKATTWLGLKASMICLALNNILPVKVGELAKAFFLSKFTQMDLSRTMSLVFWERFYDVNFLLLIGLGAIYMMGEQAILAPLAAITCGGWTLLYALKKYPALRRVLMQLTPHSRLRHIAGDLLDSLNENMRLHTLLPLAAYSALFWALNFAQTQLLINWLGGLHLSVAQTAAVFVITVLGYTIPSSPGALGVLEAAMVLGLGWFSIPREEALALALVLRCITYIPQTAAGLLFLFLSGMNISHMRDILRDATTPKETELHDI